MFDLSVGIMAHNEAASIRAAMQSVQHQRLQTGRIMEIIVVADGCSDGTEDIVRRWARLDGRIRLLTEPLRQGKARAVNRFLKESRGRINILMGADLVPDPDSFEYLIRPFVQSDVGMTGGRPVPADRSSGALPGIIRFQWRLHHRVAMNQPKLGELVAFRSVIPSISPSTWVDEAALEHFFLSHGYRLCYVPQAVVINQGPTRWSDYFRQRRRVRSGHLHFARLTGYKVSTVSSALVVRALYEELCAQGWRKWFLALSAVLVEGTAAGLAWLDHLTPGMNHTVWTPIRKNRNATQRRCDTL